MTIKKLQEHFKEGKTAGALELIGSGKQNVEGKEVGKVVVYLSNRGLYTSC